MAAAALESRHLTFLKLIEMKVDLLNYEMDDLQWQLDASSHVALPVDDDSSTLPTRTCRSVSRASGCAPAVAPSLQRELGPSNNNNNDDSYSWEELPVRTHKEFELLEAKLKQDNYYKLALEQRLMLIGGDSLRSCVKRILEVLLSDEVQLLFNWVGTNGRKSKRAFKNTELCPILTRVVVRSNEGTTEDLIHKEVRSYLRACADRYGSQQRRLRRQKRDDSEQGEDN